MKLNQLDAKNAENHLGYVTVFAKGLVMRQPIRNVKIVAICMECFQRKK